MTTPTTSKSFSSAAASAPITFCAAGLAALGSADAATVVDVNVILNAATGTAAASTVLPLALPGTAAVFVAHTGLITSLGAAVGGAFAAVGGGSLAGFLASGYNYASNLPFGAPLTGAGFIATTATMAFRVGYLNEQFTDAGIGYLGFNFDAGAGLQYGWVEVDMSGVPLNAINVVRYAYGDPGEAVFAGVIPEPNALALLALGAGGVMARRRRKR